MAQHLRLLLLPLLLLLLSSSSLPRSANAHNITKILAMHPEFSTFNHYLTVTHLASEINRRLTITVLAVDNSGMATLLAHHFTIPTLKNVLSLHLLVDYYGAKKLHQLTGGTSLSSSFFQSTGAAPGTTGFVNITDHRRGHVTFAAEDDSGDFAGPAASFVKSVKEIPYNISVIQISNPLSSPEAESPAAAPAPVNLTAVLSKNGCKMFADLISSTADVLKVYESNLEGGLTVFCPVDGAITSFMPKYKNLTDAAKASLLLFHGEAGYNSMQMLKQGNGLANTLATEGKKKNYHFAVRNAGEVITLATRVVTAKIGKTVMDQDPIAIFSIDKVLEPKELFKVKEAPAPAPEAVAPAAPKKKKKTKGKKEEPGEDATAPAGPDGAPADDEKAADDNAAAGGKERWAAVVVAAVMAAAAAVIV